MAILHQIQHWSSNHHPKWLVVLRVGLGLCLFIKGISFMSNAVVLEKAISGSVASHAISWLPIAITVLHLLGGFLIIIGLFTRLAVLVLIPILIAAIIYIGTHEAQMGGGNEFIFAGIILVLLIIFLIVGSGPLSVDSYSRKHAL
jgi:uncharacterized membrane protein YphA (DoxX/SURF4 family)